MFFNYKIIIAKIIDKNPDIRICHLQRELKEKHGLLLNYFKIRDVVIGYKSTKFTILQKIQEPESYEKIKITEKEMMGLGHKNLCDLRGFKTILK